jgi:hypothetical protein
MNFSRRAAFLCTLVVCVAASASAQFGHGGPRAPQIPTPFKPVVGSGAEYHFTGKSEDADFSYAVVGQEQVDGASGYWLEIRIANAKKVKGETVMKELMVMNGSQPEIKRLIMQPPGRPPMEMPESMIGMIQKHTPAATGDKGKTGGPGEKIGTESITVPAGTFECDHYRSQEEGSPVDLWISTQISPYGMVKMVGKDTTMVLQKVLTNETSHITEEPQKLQMPHF